jgi:hypothetical protein
VENGGAELEAIEPELGQRVLDGVLGGESDHDGAGDQPEDPALAERQGSR